MEIITGLVMNLSETLTSACIVFHPPSFPKRHLTADDYRYIPDENRVWRYQRHG